MEPAQRGIEVRNSSYNVYPQTTEGRRAMALRFGYLFNVRSKFPIRKVKRRSPWNSANLYLISKIKCFQTNSTQLDSGQTPFKRSYIHSQSTNKWITITIMVVGSLKERDPVFASNITRKVRLQHLSFALSSSWRPSCRNSAPTRSNIANLCTLSGFKHAQRSSAEHQRHNAQQNAEWK